MNDKEEEKKKEECKEEEKNKKECKEEEKKPDKKPNIFARLFFKGKKDKKKKDKLKE